MSGSPQTESHDSQKRRSYRFLQGACVAAAVCHTVAMLLCLWTYKVGHLDQFSLERLMHFPPQHPAIWKATCLALSAASLSFFFLILTLRDVVSNQWKMLFTGSLCLSVLAVCINLQSNADMLILFSDISKQYLYGGSSYSRHELSLIAWETLNRALSSCFLVSNGLYAASGFLVVAAILTGRGLPQWIGWCGLPVWIPAALAGLATLCANLPAAGFLLFVSLIAFIVWSIAIAATVDGLCQHSST
ncbi:MAG: hypothetical protein IPM23_14900 [Candidatus Melainabacteria bacterium]|nr:hypothetical protein [Candidatus Melainabacteria bacterium]